MATILVPLDGSVLAETVIPYAQHLATTLSADLVLLRVVTPRERSRLLAEEMVDSWDDTLPPREDLDRQIWELLHDEAKSYLTAQAEQLQAAGFKVETQVSVGQPAAMIIAQTEAIHPTMIVMASHGYSGLQRWALGSVADRVVSVSTTPVMIIRSSDKPQPFQIKRILTPLDGSALADQALPLAMLLAQSAKAELTLLRVIEPLAVAKSYGSMQYLRRADHLHTTAQQELEETVGTLRSKEVSASAIITSGHVAELIVDTAASSKIDMIVMATHGYTGMQRWALGSVADKVLHASDLPLILVRSQTAND